MDNRKRLYLLICLIGAGLVLAVLLMISIRIKAPLSALHPTDSATQPTRQSLVTTKEENELLAYILGYKGRGEHFVVNPHTHIDDLALPSIRKDTIEMIAKSMGHAELVERLFNENDKSVAITLTSDERQGYHIASDAEYRRFIVNNRREWLQLIKDTPNLSGLITVSIPAYEPPSGILLVYLAITTSFNASKGYIMEFELKEKQLRLLKELVLWVS